MESTGTEDDGERRDWNEQWLTALEVVRSRVRPVAPGKTEPRVRRRNKRESREGITAITPEAMTRESPIRNSAAPPSQSTTIPPRPPPPQWPPTCSAQLNAHPWECLHLLLAARRRHRARSMTGTSAAERSGAKPPTRPQGISRIVDLLDAASVMGTLRYG
jgi:hypothetical protein